jgi:cytochrome P450
MTTMTFTTGTAPHRLPLLGHTLSLMRGPVRMLHAQRGRGDLVLLHIGRHPVYLVNNPELISQMLVTDQDSFVKGRVFDKLRIFLGNGLATSEGEFHLRQRRMMTKAFHLERLRRYTAVMSDQAVATADGWRPGAVIDVLDVMYELIATTTAKTLFNAEIGARAVADIQRWLPVFMSGTIFRVLSPADILGRLPLPANRRFARARNQLRQITDEIVHEYRRDPGDHGDLLSMLVAATDEMTGEEMTEGQLRDELMTILFAGTETTSTALSWLWHELGQHPDVEARLHAEVDAVLAGRAVTFEDIAELPYVRMVVRETLRLHCPVWLPMRRAGRDLEIAGVRIPAGADLAYYPDPGLFDPDRWVSGRAPEAFVPFGLGRHKCIGDHFALTEMAVMVATIAADWRLRPVPGRRPVREVASGMLRPDQLLMTLERRGG